jgi:hypothetical protein
MKPFCHWVAMLAGGSTLVTGCSGDPLSTASHDDPTLPATRLHPQGLTGQAGTNGLKPSEYHARRRELETLLQQSLLTRRGRWNADAVDFISTPEGEKLLAYAVQCALRLGDDVPPFSGMGLMATTGIWRHLALDPQQRDDVNTCIATRLNPFAQMVPIWIGGPNTAKGTESNAYEYFEAVWSVEGPTIHVWPADTFETKTTCAHRRDSVTQEFETRICENDPSVCNLNARYDLAAACQGRPGEGNWVCDGKPAIETRLRLRDWNTMHPLCTSLEWL